MLKIYKEQEKPEEVFYLTLEDVSSSGQIKLVCRNASGAFVKNLAIIKPSGIYLHKTANGAGVATDSSNDHRMVILEEW